MQLAAYINYLNSFFRATDQEEYYDKYHERDKNDLNQKKIQYKPREDCLRDLQDIMRNYHIHSQLVRIINFKGKRRPARPSLRSILPGPSL